MDKLYDIIQKTTTPYRKGEEVIHRNVGPVAVTEIYCYKHTKAAPKKTNYEKVDMIFIDVVVDKDKAVQYKSELENILKKYPQPKRLAAGPSYIELAPNFNIEQEGALRLMALGKVLGLWDIISGKTFGCSDGEAISLAGSGLLNISGYNSKQNKAKKGDKHGK